MNRVKIVSDGTPEGSSVLIDGKKLDLVRRVDWSLEVGGISHAVIEVLGVEIDAEAQTHEINEETR